MYFRNFIVTVVFLLCLSIVPNVLAQPSFQFMHSNFAAAAFLDDQTVLLAGDRGVFNRSGDGGLTWTLEQTEFVDELPHEMLFINSRRGWVVGAEGHIITTTDGGQNWQRQTVPQGGVDLSDICMSPEGKGLCAGGPLLFYTENYGADWSVVATPTSAASIGCVEYLGDDRFAVGIQNTAWNVNPGTAAWEQIAYEFEGNIETVNFSATTRTADGKIYVGGTMDAPNEIILFSDDAGAEWTTIPAPGHVRRIVANGTTVVVAATSTSLYYSTDGAEWQLGQYPEPRPGTSLTDIANGGLAMRGNSLVLALENHGISRTGNAGQTWEALSYKVPTPIDVGAFQSSGAGVVTGIAGDFCGTADGGATWTIMPVDPTFRTEGFLDVEFNPAAGGLAAGLGAPAYWNPQTMQWERSEVEKNEGQVIYTRVGFGSENRFAAIARFPSTTDPMAWGFLRNLSRDEPVGKEMVFGMHREVFQPTDLEYLEADSWIVCGLNPDIMNSNSMIARTDDAGLSWQYTSFEELPGFNSISKTANNEFVAGDIEGKLWHSADGGATWSSVELNWDNPDEVNFSRSAFDGAQNGIAVANIPAEGDAANISVIFSSADAGRSWNPLIEFRDFILLKAEILADGSAVVYGPEFQALRIDNVVVTSAAESPAAGAVNSSAGFTVNISPNPAQEIAHVNIRSEVGFSAAPELHVTDVRGREVLHLSSEVSGLVGSREATLELPVQSLASGSYFVDVTIGAERVSVPLVISGR